MAKDPEFLAHLEWLGYVQPVGLVVSIPALLAAQSHVNRNIGPDHARFLACLPAEGDGEPIPEIRDFAEFTREVLGWESEDLVGHEDGPPLPETLELVLPEYQETLRPTFAVPEVKPAEDASPWIMLIQELPRDTAFDDPGEEHGRHWHASPHAKFERLLRETSVPIGLLVSPTALRLVYAPRGETSGYITFNVGEMTSVAGRPIFAGLHMLLCGDRLFSLGEKQRLPAILADSRKYQNTVSSKLAEQVLAALYELVRGFQAADDQTHGELLRQVLAEDPNHVYGGLLTVLMRLVFILYAEDRGLLSTDKVYTNYYSVTGLFERLRADAGRYPDTMHQRYGAWAQLLTLFRLVHDGGSHGQLAIPPRKGYLFDPDRYNFLEGRPWRAPRDQAQETMIPRVSDGIIYRVLRNLLVLEGERLSYRTLDVEQIGSVYETMMGFDLEVSGGPSIALKPTKSHGAPTTINLEALLAVKPAGRAAWLKDHAEQKITGQMLAALKKAETLEDLLDALEKKIARKITPDTIPPGAMILQPTDERRRTGSHYTPRSLTQPIVRTTLEPILARLVDPAVELPAVWEPTARDKKELAKDDIAHRRRVSGRAHAAAQAGREKGVPHPEQLLDLKICDPAMGSGAFLVETCRQLAEELVRAWSAHDCLPADIPPDEDELLYARRLVAQRCLYGVDKNRMAVDLAKLSLWLATLAQDHPFTFLDHTLRCGDSLVGLTKRQIMGFHWEPKKQKDIEAAIIESRIQRATAERRRILEAREDVAYLEQAQRLALADDALEAVRMIGDACISAFFAGKKKKEREERCDELFGQLSEWFAQGMNPANRAPLDEAAASLLTGPHPLPPFHWQIEFPEVFLRENAGFDVFVGNPPFLGGLLISELYGGPEYQEWLKANYEFAFGNCDMAAYFFRRTYELVNNSGTLGLLATKTISEGGTRTTGLQTILRWSGRIYNATRSMRWPGDASVLVACVHIAARHVTLKTPPRLDGREVSFINSRLHPSEEVADPVSLVENDLKGFYGTNLGGVGFILDPEEYNRLSATKNNQKCLFPCLGGQDVNQSPTQSSERYAISFRSESLEYAESFPELLQIVRGTVKPERDKAPDHGPGKHGKKYWWQHTLRADPLYRAVSQLPRCLVTAITTSHLAFSFQPIRQVFTHSLVVFAFDQFSPFSCLQSRIHQVWAELLSSSLGMTLRYSVRDSFQTFPAPPNYDTSTTLEFAGSTYYEYRSRLMKSRTEGFTSTYNRFHDPHEHSLDILKLRELHDAMDRAVLEAYGWDDLARTATCEFLLDYEEDDEDEATGKKSKRKKPYRLRWPDAFRDEVLARLLELNAERARQERLAGLAAEASTKKKAAKGGGKKAARNMAGGKKSESEAGGKTLF